MLPPWRMNSFTSLNSQLAFNIPVYNYHFSIGEAKSWDNACDIHSLTFPFYAPVTWRGGLEGRAKRPLRLNVCYFVSVVLFK